MATSAHGAVDVMLVGYETLENLGLRSLKACLAAQGYRVVLVPFQPGCEDLVLFAARTFQPRLIGFSLIFQYALGEFGDLLLHLRAQGVTAHFTAGGHYPSLRPSETLTLLSELDSVIRFEGELTLLELLAKLNDQPSWETILGLAYRQGGEVKVNPPRPLIEDLDTLPPVDRDELQEFADGIKMAAMLASRGCLFDCSFCSIRSFYGEPAGALRRARSPLAVVQEMATLYREKDVRFFSFQDDDFAARSPRQREWLATFLRGLDGSGLVGKTCWKIACRVDDLDSETLAEMQRRGLIAVYLGVESGSAAGLRTLNKRISVAQNLAGVALLKEHGLAMAMGFMLFDPSSTLDTIRENLDFLRAAGADGYFPINFCKMLPYAGTPIERQLQEEGRLRGTTTQPDYSFLDPRLDGFEFLVQSMFSRRNFGPQGLVARLQHTDLALHLARALGRQEATSAVHLRNLVEKTNLLAIDTLDSLLNALRDRGLDPLLADQAWLVALAEQEWRGEIEAEVELMRLLQESGHQGQPANDRDLTCTDLPSSRV